MVAPLHILIDSRERAPWAWEASDATTEIVGLAAGDYAVAQDAEKPKRAGALRPVRFSIERKHLEDFISTISTGWERFQRELIRMEAFPARVVIVEGDFAQCCFVRAASGVEPPAHNHPVIQPSFVARRVAELTMQGVSVLFAGDAELAAGLAFRIFKRRLETCQQTD